ncbi:MAG TPA: hypothetical protein ACQGQF_03780 [Xylella fastidiosa subsp. pauca]
MRWGSVVGCCSWGDAGVQVIGQAAATTQGAVVNKGAVAWVWRGVCLSSISIAGDSDFYQFNCVISITLFVCAQPLGDFYLTSSPTV